MVSKFLLPESVARQDGAGPEIALEANCGKPLMLTLGVTRAIEQESLEISILGSRDGRHWGLIQSFPRKFYCGTYAMMLDLSPHPKIRYIRAEWKMTRWGRDNTPPLFDFYLAIDEPRLQAAGAA